MEYNKNLIDTPLFHEVGRAADELGQTVHVVGGYVRDLVLGRHSKDIDFTTEGSGLALAALIGERVGSKVHEFKAFRTAQLRWHGVELEFVGARRESYRAGSRKPVTEDATFEEDIARRDFTINAMAISLNAATFGQFVDLYDGLGDIGRRIIRTPGDPDRAFTEDPLRILRAIRFATQLDFTIDPVTLDSIVRNRDQVATLSAERIKDELCKIMRAPVPSIGWRMLLDTGLLAIIMPEIAALHGVETVRGRAHKENFDHTMKVLDKVAERSDDEWLRWGALLHDVGKPVTRRWDDRLGWTFHNHSFIGARMVPGIFRRLRLPLNADMKKVQNLVELHMRPVALVEDTVTDSAVRRLGTDAGENLPDLMILCEADVTSRNPEKVRRCMANLALVKEKVANLKVSDNFDNYQPPVNGLITARVFGLPVGDPNHGRTLGAVKSALKEAWRDGIITEDYDENFDYMLSTIAPALGLVPVDTRRHVEGDTKPKKEPKK